MPDDLELRLDLTQRGDFHQEMRPRVSARLVASSTMLGLSSMAMHEAIVQELADNPALEADEVGVCDVCATPLQGSVCPTCLRLQRAELGPDQREWDVDLDRGPERGQADDGFDPLAGAADRETLAERLLRDLGALLPRAEMPIARQLVGNLDRRGYLDISVDEVADLTGAEPARVEAVLAALQTLEPVGVGARDLRECLLLQLDHLASQGIDCPVAWAVVEDHLAWLAGRKIDRIARALRVPVAEVERAASFVRQRLNPFPAQGHAGPEAATEARAAYVRPDVVVVAQDGGFVVEVVESRRLTLRVADAYAQLTRRAAELPADERAHVLQYATRARLFVRNVAQRRRTVRKITEAVVAAQGGFLRNGVRDLQPLTRSQIALRTGLDESTVSRATNGRFVLLPSGEVVSFDTFFTPSLAVHAVIRDILAAEGRPLTDRAIAGQLAARGVHIARRTVTKYRARIRALPSTLRPDGGPRAA
ncbi:MAG TPA: RNA polymerase sigma-54 factor [Chloroflexota bacterium]|nr:RNA polymerase sigma-54 factor [Chloroflexota bacterium]